MGIVGDKRNNQMLKWKVEIKENVKNMSNEELLNETLSIGSVDMRKYKTYIGQWEYDCVVLELKHRLKDWLKII